MIFEPMPVPAGSLSQPTTPVMAPPYGSSAEGLLCVSTLNAMLVIICEFNDAGVILKNGYEPVHALRYLAGGALDVRLEQAVDGLLFTVLVIVDGRVEDLMLAVLAPGLRERL